LILESGPLSGWGRFILLQKFAKYVLKVFGPLAASAQMYNFRAMQYIWVKNDFFTIKGLWVSKDAEFYVDSKNINMY
jgi:hypothetical protein